MVRLLAIPELSGSCGDRCSLASNSCIAAAKSPWLENLAVAIVLRCLDRGVRLRLARSLAERAQEDPCQSGRAQAAEFAERSPQQIRGLPSSWRLSLLSAAAPWSPSPITPAPRESLSSASEPPPPSLSSSSYSSSSSASSSLPPSSSPASASSSGSAYWPPFFSGL